MGHLLLKHADAKHEGGEAAGHCGSDGGPRRAPETLAEVLLHT